VGQSLPFDPATIMGRDGSDCAAIGVGILARIKPNSIAIAHNKMSKAV
jgi:hypothetical protein